MSSSTQVRRRTNAHVNPFVGTSISGYAHITVRTEPSVFELAITSRIGLILLALITATVLLSYSPVLASSNSEIHLTRIDHVGLNVTDLQRSADWYQRVLGFTIFHKWNTTWMIRRGEMRIGLFLRPNAATIQHLDNTVAITHFALLTDAKGFSLAQSRLKELGIKFDGPDDTGVAHSLFIYDPDGYQVEITTYYKQTQPQNVK